MMADALDYGDDDAREGRRNDAPDQGALQYDEGGEDMEGIDTDVAAEGSGRRDGVKVYAFPEGLAVEAGARRGPSPAVPEDVDPIDQCE